ncbi:1-deoxy-D-xylulose-5-phosphate synthase [uncultured Clostridium sp.]|jgi:1-deoxy-D-xylulose-5-phosphate synthase|uniref:1-deoxy-D-xylulose-5-phosphate synthase n=1 Tax=uncultured Clostridium sp. TaxID=59620 RepID=UPI00260EBE6F|nr:1-deoxy-D-xylulose-5-phosphate synthase [uncultured Clostridium sp.]
MIEILNNSKGKYKIKDLKEKELEILAQEIREFLINNISKTGGHLASNLGVVEVTLALFKNFNFDNDKVIWDVGHQSYVHKLITDRKDDFSTLRQYNGLSGFPKRIESKYDFFDTGHSSTSISAAIGMARARDIRKEDSNVIAVIGDGALTGGMALEALNDIGYNKTKMIVILNDNQMSISQNVGGLSAHLNKIRADRGYNKLKAEINATLSSSHVGKNIAHSLGKIKGSIKQLVIPSMIFEDMGLKYFGPIDGHDLKELNEVIETAKEIDGPVVIHAITQKGKGYNFAEENPNKFHGVGPFDYSSGEMLKVSKTKQNYSNAFGDAMIKIAKEDKDVVAITAAMPDGTGLKSFSKEYKDRFFDVGIAEQHATTMAAGMALSGLKPVFAVYSTFLQRAYDQVIHDVCIQKLPVVFAIDRAGIVGEDGETHQGMFDVSFLGIIPNMTILAPKMIEEVEGILKWAVDFNKPVAIRYPRGTDYEDLDFKPLSEINLGKWETIKEGEKLAIIASGKMLQHASIAVNHIDNNESIEIINSTFIKPIDTKLIDSLNERGMDILVIEDGVLRGGMGEGIISYLNNKNYTRRIECIGYDDKFIVHGKVDMLYKENNLDPASIKDKILELLK